MEIFPQTSQQFTNGQLVLKETKRSWLWRRYRQIIDVSLWAKNRYCLRFNWGKSTVNNRNNSENVRHLGSICTILAEKWKLKKSFLHVLYENCCALNSNRHKPNFNLKQLRSKSWKLYEVNYIYETWLMLCKDNFSICLYVNIGLTAEW